MDNIIDEGPSTSKKNQTIELKSKNAILDKSEELINQIKIIGENIKDFNLSHNKPDTLNPLQNNDHETTADNLLILQNALSTNINQEVGRTLNK